MIRNNYNSFVCIAPGLDNALTLDFVIKLMKTRGRGFENKSCYLSILVGIIFKLAYSNLVIIGLHFLSILLFDYMAIKFAFWELHIAIVNWFFV